MSYSFADFLHDIRAYEKADGRTVVTIPRSSGDFRLKER
jgi:hypothetical protein